MSDTQTYIDSIDNLSVQVEKKSKRKVIEWFSKNLLKSSAYRYIHVFLALFAIYISFRCNNGFEFWSFLAALCCPVFYVIYMLISTNGTACIGNICDAPKLELEPAFESGI